MRRKCSEQGKKKRRKQLREVKKDIIDREKVVEKGDSYVPGGFWWYAFHVLFITF